MEDLNLVVLDVNNTELNFVDKDDHVDEIELKEKSRKM